MFRNYRRENASGSRRHSTKLDFSGDNNDNISESPSNDSNLPWEMPIQGKPAEIVSQLANVVPKINTDRLYLRAPKLEDFQAYCDIAMSDRWHDTGLTCKEDVWLDFLQMVAGWMLRGVGLLTVVNSTHSNLVGFVLLNHEFGDKHLEIGWMLVQEEEGKGYATEAAQALLDYAMKNLALLETTPIVSYIAPTNTKSMKVAERLGGRRASEMESDCIVYFYE